MIKPGILCGQWKTNGCTVTANGALQSTVVCVPSKDAPKPTTDALAVTKGDALKLAQAISSLPDLLNALELLFHGCEQAQKNGLNQPQVNGGMILAKSALITAGYTF